MKSYRKVPHKYTLYRRKFESNNSAALTISPLGLVGVAVRQLAMASALARVARWRKKTLRKEPPWFETATYRKGHGEVLHSHIRKLEGMKLAARTSDLDKHFVARLLHLESHR